MQHRTRVAVVVVVLVGAVVAGVGAIIIALTFAQGPLVDLSSLDRLKTARCRDGLVLVPTTDPRFRDGIACGQSCVQTGARPCDMTVESTLPSTTTTGR